MSGVRRFSHLHTHCSQCPPCPPCPQEPHVNRKCRTEGEMSHRRLGEKQIYFQALSASIFPSLLLTVGTQSHGNTVLCEVTCCSFVGLSGRRYHTKKRNLKAEISGKCRRKLEGWQVYAIPSRTRFLQQEPRFAPCSGGWRQWWCKGSSPQANGQVSPPASLSWLSAHHQPDRTARRQ